ncbi:MAG: hypothetical protein ACYTXC_04310, partial [Nostoc sp.]
DRFKLLDILLNHNSFVGPSDANVIEKIWNSFGKNLGEVASKYFEVWKQCNSHTLVNLEALPELVGMKLQFKQAIAARAKGYLEDNKKLVKSEQERLGLDNPTVPATAEQSGNVAEIVELAKKVQAAQDALDHKFPYIPVGYTKIAADDDDPNDTPKKIFVYFNPANKPDIPPDGTEKPPMATWDKTNEEYNKTSAAIDGISGKYPAIFALIRDGKINEVAQGNDQAKIRQAIAKPLKDTFDNILKTEPLLNDPGSDFALELEPIHQQFFQSEPPWNLPFQKSITQKAIQEHGSQEFWKTIGIGTMQLALFVVAELSTGGLATFFLAAGAIASAGQAAAAWQKYDQAQSAANTNLSKETALISQDQANNALFDAVLTTAFTFLDFYSAAGSALSAEAKATKLASVEAAEAKTLAEATETAEKSIGGLRNELTVEKTATEETHEFKFFKDGTIRRCSDPPCNFLIDSFKARADKALNELAADSPLRQQAEALSNEANAIQKEYTDLAKRAEKLPEAEREAQLSAGEAPIRQRLEKAERSMADVEVEVGDANLAALRAKYNLPENLDTICVGKTDIPGIEGSLEGLSPKPRQQAGLPPLDPSRSYKSPFKNPAFTKHAEEDILNQFSEKIKKLGLTNEALEGKTISIHISNPNGVCNKCTFGLMNDVPRIGVIKQFSLDHPTLTIRITAPENPPLIIKNGSILGS